MNEIKHIPTKGFIFNLEINQMPTISIKYTAFISGLCLLICDEMLSDSQTLASIFGLVLLVIGLYLISKGIGEKPEMDPYAVKSYDEEE